VVPADGWTARVTRGPTDVRVAFVRRATGVSVIASCAAGSPRFTRGAFTPAPGSTPGATASSSTSGPSTGQPPSGSGRHESPRLNIGQSQVDRG
jgi:hypothetical protein